MTEYVFLGYGVTDENGIAKLEYDANGDPLDHSYTGVGAGSFDVIASLDNPIVDGSFTSRAFHVVDAKSYDDGTKTLSDYWNNTSALTRNSDETTTFSTSNWSTSNFKVDNNVNLVLGDGLTVEFDVLSIEGSPRINGYDGGHKGVILTQTGHYKAVFEPGTMTVYVNGEIVNTIEFATAATTVNIGFRSGSSSSTVKFDNFALY